ncbi:hypothetical protein [Photobacterium leiognathi]|uniref:hypothetical protein n=1 Tax=Photobacterium leiognathi TaxID=553611 RepID=UPI00298161FA|nr:hypothetical protein [Photobacterium leiognathi]
MEDTQQVPTAENVNWFSQVGEFYGLAKPDLLNTVGVFSSTSKDGRPKITLQHTENAKNLSFEQCHAELHDINDVFFIAFTFTESNGHQFKATVAVSELMHSDDFPKELANQPLEVELHVWHPRSKRLISVTSFVTDVAFTGELFSSVLEQPFDNLTYTQTIEAYKKSMVRLTNREPLFQTDFVMIKNKPNSNEPFLAI